jgi:lipopolysaccharide/colanic/teichoic acid biosynthesis glycosyltransferase
LGRQVAIEAKRGLMSGLVLVAKRSFDLVLATIALLALVPLFGLVSIAIKLDSRGPVILPQRGYGFDRLEFTVYNFRTVRLQEGPGTVRRSQNNNDDGITRIGRVLRETGIDKLPQLLNVLRGEMSLVSPLLPAFAHDDEYAFRHLMKPGVTGLPQIDGGTSNIAQAELMKQKGVLGWYIENWSIWLDGKIVIHSCFERPLSQGLSTELLSENPASCGIRQRTPAPRIWNEGGV